MANFYLVVILTFSAFIWPIHGRIIPEPASETFIVKLSGGKIRGRTLNTKNGNSAYIFLGIPFAEPPVADLRFQPPVPKKPWPKIIDCLQYGPACMQNASNSPYQSFELGENCLQIDVFVHPTCSVSDPCPVLNFILGGARYFDDPRKLPLEPQIDNFVSNRLILVTTSYRQGAFAYWNTPGSDAVLGNGQEYDMLEGLKWIQREIKAFGGDPSMVTPMGCSSSATSIDQLSLSPMAEGTYNQMAIMSGPASNFDDSEEVSKEFAIRAGCATAEQWDSREYDPIVRCMTSLSSWKLLDVQTSLSNDGLQYGGPRIDGKLFTAQVNELRKNRKPIRTMIGTTLWELVPPILGVFLGDIGKGDVRELCKSVAPAYGLKGTDELADSCASYYTADNKDYKSIYTQLLRGFLFESTYQEAQNLVESGAEVYLYSFEYVKNGTDGISPGHAYDLFYMMQIYLEALVFPLNDLDRQVGALDGELFSNFAKYGDPTPKSTSGTLEKWMKLASQSDSNYYRIDLEPTNLPFYHEKDLKFWTKIAPQLNPKKPNVNTNFKLPHLDKIGYPVQYYNLLKSYMMVEPVQQSSLDSKNAVVEVKDSSVIGYNGDNAKSSSPWSLISLAAVGGLVAICMVVLVVRGFSKKRRSEANREKVYLLGNEVQ